MTPDAFLQHLRQASLAEQLDLLAVLREQMRRRTLELDAQIAAVEAERQARLGWMVEACITLEQAIKEECLAQAQSVKGLRSDVQVVYVSGRVTWDTDRLEGYAEEHPEIRRFRKVGKPGAKIV